MMPFVFAGICGALAAWFANKHIVAITQALHPELVGPLKEHMAERAKKKTQQPKGEE